jgi:hypothetical protein
LTNRLVAPSATHESNQLVAVRLELSEWTKATGGIDARQFYEFGFASCRLRLAYSDLFSDRGQAHAGALKCN